MPALESYYFCAFFVVFSTAWYGTGNPEIRNSTDDEVHSTTFISSVEDACTIQGFVRLATALFVVLSCRIVWRNVRNVFRTQVHLAAQDYPLAPDPAATPLAALPDRAAEPDDVAALAQAERLEREARRDAAIVAALEVHRNRTDRLFDLATNYDQFGRPTHYEIPGFFAHAYDVSPFELLSSTARLPATSISWSCDGSLLAIAHGSLDLIGSRDSVICLWNVRQGKRTSVRPKILNHRSCTTFLAFHPMEITTLSAGTADGSVMIFRGDVTLTSSDPKPHQSCVTCLKWLCKHHVSTLVSAGMDGRIFFWLVDEANKTLNEMQRFMLLQEAKPERVLRGIVNTPVPIRTMSFKAGSETNFLVGSDDGDIYYYSVKTSGPCCVGKANVLLKRTYAKHQSTVVAVETSSLSKSQFLTASSDGTIRMYSLKEKEPFRTMNPNVGPVVSTSWSSVRSTAFAAGAANGELLLYDFAVSRREPVDKLRASSVAIRSVKFCHANKRFLATGDDNGIVVIWHLPERLTTPSPDESDWLQR